MIDVVRLAVAAILTTLVGIVLFEARATSCPVPRFAMIGNSPDGRTIVVFDSCLGVAYATPVTGLPDPEVRRQKDVEI